MEETFYTIEKAAELLQVTPRVLRSKVSAGLIASHKKLGRLYIFHTDLVKYIKQE